MRAHLRAAWAAERYVAARKAKARALTILRTEEVDNAQNEEGRSFRIGLPDYLVLAPGLEPGTR